MFKSGFITIIGRPNVGKSTLLNTIIGEKLSIVSCKPQTTRNNINTILTQDNFQLIFVDTPGIHKPKDKLGNYMVKSAEDSIKDVDLVLFLTTPQDDIGGGDRYILENIREAQVPVFLVLNKIDENPASRTAETLKNYSEFFNFQEIVPVSALKKKNTDELLDLMVKYMPEGPKYYPDDAITDKQEKFIVAEIIREKALRLLSKEVPHGIAIEIIFMRKDSKGIYNIEANILCEKESHKGIIIGKNGSMLKKISSYARMDIEKFLDSRVYLQVWVKVRKEWRDNDRLLKELGYKI
ncbi:GTPase Era [Clostridium luticellarii]|jgi:GTP-binding protein Era|uniref:GTPase Era n=1 Tax=Clostridium luticellarii TaxID=1691940 RepID=A0A2T0BM29_9CLOT|nr:GTPase Era [Clostridium luticellarii]MCI1944100.1 GTPase Era [Clostridium luticellarii]MCI1967258.1 GTPase Era [Clostridium luticellarii]MCI1995169.1 GTPase Era [Clostridium luticellarii]MCI2039335.1 GTPase Era [Clostridium luticellarii]PRR84903.1 GTPase Era [Clostridium luticellarii]